MEFRMKHSLSKQGLSMSQAQSISNLCNQRAMEIDINLRGVNNANKTVMIGGVTYDETVGKKMPANVVELLKERSSLYAAQAFLMENTKAKAKMLDDLRKLQFEHDVEQPVALVYPTANLLSLVDDAWGMNQLTIAEACEYMEVEAYAAHIGQFIHKDGQLTKLRNELPLIKTLQFITVKDGEKTPVKVVTHHTPEELMNYHLELATLHRDYESRVNYFKAKVKNLVSERNAEISKSNANELGRVNSEIDILRKEYMSQVKLYNSRVEQLRHVFEQKRQDDIHIASALRISVDKRFQPVIDMFMDKTSTKI